MNILITGGAGFIGSECVRQIAKREGVVISVVDKLTYAGDKERIKEVEDRINFYEVDICEKEMMEKVLEKEKPEVIIHLAAESHVDRSIVGPEVFIESNIKGTHVMLELAKKYGVKRFLNISTDEVYGDLEEEGQFFEDTPLNPSSPYSASKAAADMLGRSYFRTYGLGVITIRPSNNYGPWQYPEKLIPVVITNALESKKIPIYGKGENVREWCHVSDSVRGILEILDKGVEGEIYNLGGGNERDNLTIVKTVLKELKKPESLIEFIPDRLGHDFRYSLNSDKMEKEFGFKPEIKFEQGFIDTISWYVENGAWLDKLLKRKI